MKFAFIDLTTNTPVKTCYCFTCHKDYHYLGIARHRRMHADRKEDCTIQYTDGKIYGHRFNKEKSK